MKQLSQILQINIRQISFDPIDKSYIREMVILLAKMKDSYSMVFQLIRRKESCLGWMLDFQFGFVIVSGFTF